mgnify:CR=1 FL=1
MKKKVIGDHIEPKCEYCVHGELSADSIHILCIKKGILEPDYSCKKFIYDALKRTPRRPTEVQQFSAEDFEL